MYILGKVKFKASLRGFFIPKNKKIPPCLMKQDGMHSGEMFLFVN